MVQVRRRWRLPLASQLVVVQLIVIGAVLLAVSAVSVEITRLGFARDEGRRVLTLAENLAANPVVRSEDVDRAGAVLPAATTPLQALTGVDLVMIADRRDGGGQHRHAPGGRGGVRGRSWRRPRCDRALRVGGAAGSTPT